MTISLGAISALFSPASSSSPGQNFLENQTPSDPITAETLVIGQALSNALGNAQINRTVGSSTLAADAAINRIHAEIAAKQKQNAKETAFLKALFTKGSTVNKTA